MQKKKKVVVFGGGTGLSCLLSGLKLFPIEVTTVIAVSDNGSSTGILKEELDIPAVGDVGKVLLSMANVDEDFVNLLQYRFSKSGTLYNHPVRNIMLAALIDMKGNLTEATKYMSTLLNISGTVLPLTEEKVDLVGKGDEAEFFGEEEVSRNIKDINRLTYDHDISVSDEIIQKVMEADLIIFSPGSLYTSIVPHLLAKDVIDAIDKTKAPLMYVSNLVTQPGETDDYKVSDHIKILNMYLGKRNIDYVIANNAVIDEEILLRYVTTENKKAVTLDSKYIADELNTKVIEDDIFSIENGKVRHDSLKTAYIIFSFLMDGIK
ncbi:MAG: YvcK family protein [Lachnospiraceae bacterium]|nr:YvcK family protein [Candidatus Colinaster equi]